METGRKIGWFLGSLVLAGSLYAMFVLRSGPSTGGLESGPAAGSMPAPEKIYGAEFDDEDGNTVPLARWKGQLVVLNFWATWCAPCVKEMPDLQRAQDELGQDAVRIVGIGAEPPAAVRAFRKANGLRFALLAGNFEAINAARALGDQQGVLPYTALLSPEGRVLHTQVGELPPGRIRQWVEEYRGKSSASG